MGSFQTCQLGSDKKTSGMIQVVRYLPCEKQFVDSFHIQQGVSFYEWNFEYFCQNVLLKEVELVDVSCTEVEIFVVVEVVEAVVVQA